MSLSCSCDSYSDFFHEAERKARKSHVCYECRAAIDKGDIYYTFASKTDGDFCSWKTCEPCRDLGLSLGALGFCWYVGDLRDAHAEYLREYAPKKINFTESKADQ